MNDICLLCLKESGSDFKTHSQELSIHGVSVETIFYIQDIVYKHRNAARFLLYPQRIISPRPNLSS